MGICSRVLPLDGITALGVHILDVGELGTEEEMLDLSAWRDVTVMENMKAIRNGPALPGPDQAVNAPWPPLEVNYPVPLLTGSLSPDQTAVSLALEPGVNFLRCVRPHNRKFIKILMRCPGC